MHCVTARKATTMLPLSQLGQGSHRPQKRRFTRLDMSHREPVTRQTVIKAVAVIVPLIAVLIFAPRMEGPRFIGGVAFTTKTGSAGLTNLGWLLLVTVPVASLSITSLVLKLVGERKRD